MRRGKNTRKKSSLSLHTIIAVVTLLLVLGGFLLGSSLNHARQAHASGESQVYKYYTSIRIQEGDTLWELADSYLGESCAKKSEYIDEIKRLNKIIDEDEIRSGEYLLIPYYSNEYL